MKCTGAHENDLAAHGYLAAERAVRSGHVRPLSFADCPPRTETAVLGC
jgi:hypothetical protein